MSKVCQLFALARMTQNLSVNFRQELQDITTDFGTTICGHTRTPAHAADGWERFFQRHQPDDAL